MPVVVPSNPSAGKVRVVNIGNTPGYAMYEVVEAGGKWSEHRYHSARMDPDRPAKSVTMPWPEGVPKTAPVSTLRVVTHTFTGERIAVERSYDRRDGKVRAQLRSYRYGTKPWPLGKQGWQPLALVPWDSTIDDEGPLLG